MRPARSARPTTRDAPRTSRRRCVVVLPLAVVAGVVLAAPPASPPAAAATDTALQPAAARRAPAERAAHARGRVLVGFTATATARQRRVALAEAGAWPLARLGSTTVAGLHPGADVEQAAGRLAAAPGVAFAEPDYLRAEHACPECWQLDPGDGPRRGTGVRALHARGITGAGAVVALLDTGVGEVPDLAGQVLSRRACTMTCGPAGQPASPHGTLVAGLIAARADRAGTTGVAPGARLRAWQVDTGEGIPASAVVAALHEVMADPRIGVVNMSFGGTGFSAAERAAVGRVLAAGKVVVASSGNDGSYVPQYPAGYRGVLSVGATAADGQVAAFTSYGKLDLLAPGTCLPVAYQPSALRDEPPDPPEGRPGPVPTPEDCPAPRPGVAYVTGTSFAAPLVAGVLALRRASTPLRSRLGLLGTAHAEAVTGLDDAKRQAHGLVDATAWVGSFAAGAGPYLVAEASQQLAHPAAAQPTVWHAYLLRSTGDGLVQIGDPPPAARFAGVTAGRARFRPVEPGVQVARLPSGRLKPGAGTVVEQATVRGEEGTMRARVAVRVLRPDDQAPGVPLRGLGPWRHVDDLHGGGVGPALEHDVDDVRAVRMVARQRLDARLHAPVAGIGLALFAPGTSDVLGQMDQVVASGTAPDPQGRSSLRFTARAAGIYLLDVYAQGLETSRTPVRGRYTLDVTVR